MKNEKSTIIENDVNINISLLKKYPVLLISAAIILVLLIVSSMRLFSSMRYYSKEKHGLQAALNRLQQLYHRDPYPLIENAEVESENFDKLLDVYNALNESLSAGQVEAQRMEAADFMPLLENTLRSMKNQMEKARIIFPSEFAFGFEKYAGGQLPAPDDISRLVQQLKIIEKLCQVLNEAGVTELISISRKEFETGARVPGATRRRRREAPVLPVQKNRQFAKDQPYEIQHFTIAFRASEHSAFDVLNRLARCPMFNVVTYVQMANTKQSPGERITAVPLPQRKAVSGVSRTAEPESRGRHVVLGKEDLEVKLEVDVYYFVPFIAFQDKG